MGNLRGPKLLLDPFLVFQFPKDPWDDLYIYLHEWLIFMANVGINIEMNNFLRGFVFVLSLRYVS